MIIEQFLLNFLKKWQLLSNFSSNLKQLFERFRVIYGKFNSGRLQFIEQLSQKYQNSLIADGKRDVVRDIYPKPT